MIVARGGQLRSSVAPLQPSRVRSRRHLLAAVDPERDPGAAPVGRRDVARGPTVSRRGKSDVKKAVVAL